MKNLRILSLTVFFLFVQSYLLQNLFPALLAFAISIYILYVFLEFDPKLYVSREVDKILYEGKKNSAKLRIESHTKKIYFAKLYEDFSEKVCFKIKEGENEFIYSIIPPKGVYRIRGLLEVWDSRRLFRKNFSIPESEVEVIPSLESLEEAKISVAYSAKSLFGLPLDFHSLREFQSGDDTRKIDWKASARLGELIVKEFIREWEGDVYIVLDASREMRKKLDFSLGIVKQLLNSMRDKSVGFVVFDERGVRKIIRAKKEAKIDELKITPVKGDLSLKVPELRISKFLRKFLKKLPKLSLNLIKELPRKSFLIFISDLSNPDELLRVLIEIRKECKSILLSPNPILLYKGQMTKETLLKLYKAHLEREKFIRRINTIVPTIDVAPGDKFKEVIV